MTVDIDFFKSLSSEDFHRSEKIIQLFAKNGRSKQSKFFLSKSDLKSLIKSQEDGSTLQWCISEGVVEDMTIEGVKYFYVSYDTAKAFKQFLTLDSETDGVSEKPSSADDDPDIMNRVSSDTEEPKKSEDQILSQKQMHIKILSAVSLFAFVVTLVIYFTKNYTMTFLFSFLGVLIFVFTIMLAFMKSYKPVIKSKPTSIYYLASLVLSLLTTVLMSYSFVMESLKPVPSPLDNQINSEVTDYLSTGDIVGLYQDLGFTILNEDGFLLLIEPLIINNVDQDSMSASSSIGLMNVDSEDLTVSFKLQAVDADAQPIGDPIEYQNVSVESNTTEILNGFDTTDRDIINQLSNESTSYVLLEVDFAD